MILTLYKYIKALKNVLTLSFYFQTANFGKGFIFGHNPDEYMRIMRILRVLNTLRHERIAMPLTFKQ